MSTVKISELAPITVINANTSNTLLMGVDIPTGVTGKFTAHTLAQGLYLNEVLNVGNNAVVFPNTIAQFSGNSITYLQMNMQNFESSGSGDFIVTADTGTNANSFLDLGINNSGYSDPDFSAMEAYDGYLYVHGPSDTGNTGNLVIGTAASGANLLFMVGGTESSNVVGIVTKNGLVLNRPIVFADGTSQNTSVGTSAALYANGAFLQANASFLQANTPSWVANSAALYANGAFIQANAAFLVANTPPTIANSAALYANGAFIQANAAFIVANSALANTTGTFGGNLTVAGNVSVLGLTTTTNLIVTGTSTLTGNVVMNASTYMTGGVTVNSTMILANSNFSATEAALTISASPTVATPSNDGYMLHISGKNGVASRVVTDSYGTGAYALYAGRAARGTVSAPSALQANDVISRISSNGYGTTKYQSLGVGRIDFIASENFTDANTGSRIEFYNCPIGSNTQSKIATFNGESAVFTGVVNPQKGFEYTPNNITTVATTHTIDFQRDSMVRFSVNDNMTITLQNYVYGKLVEVWITNSAAQNKTITHGCLANNSTSKATTFTISSNACAFLRYFSIDGDQANTFVSIVA